MAHDAAELGAVDLTPPVERSVALYVHEALCRAEAELDRQLAAPGVSNYLLHVRRVVDIELWGDRLRDDACQECGGYGFVLDHACPQPVSEIRCRRPCPTCMGVTVGGEWQGCLCARNASDNGDSPLAEVLPFKRQGVTS